MTRRRSGSFASFNKYISVKGYSQRVCTYTRCIVSLMDGYRSITFINDLLKVEGH